MNRMNGTGVIDILRSLRRSFEKKPLDFKKWLNRLMEAEGYCEKGVERI